MSKDWAPVDHGQETDALRPRVARGITWTVAELWGRQALNLAVFAVLTRLLTAADFGLVALATVFVSFAQLVVDQGLGDALIQRREVTRRHLDTAFWAAVVTGGGLTILGIVLAAPIASALHQPDLAPILQILSGTFLLAAFTSIQVALLRRELAFRSLAVRSIAAASGGGIVGITMASLGLGAWALVGQQVGAAVLSVIALWTVSPWRPGFAFDRAKFRELFSFGAHVVGSDMLNFFSRNVDNLLIGAFLGPIPLGLYAVGYKILDVSQTMLLNIARRITFPAFSRLQGDRVRLRQAYFRVGRAGSLVILPSYVGLALVAPELTVTVFGHQWRDSGTVALVLFLVGPLFCIQAFSDSLLNAAGRPDVVFRYRLITAVTNVVGFVIAVPFGIVPVAAAYTIRGYLLAPLLLRWMRVYAGIPAREYLLRLRGIAASTAVMALAVLVAKLALANAAGTGVRLVVEASVGAVTYAALIWFIERSTALEVLGLARQAIPHRRVRSAAIAHSTIHRDS